jgi:two-component system response regulator FixJ
MDSTMKCEPTVHVIDDDQSIRDSLSVLLRTAGFCGRFFASAEAFLSSLKDRRPVCALLDVCLPGMSGLELQRQLSIRGIEAALVVMTGQGDVPLAVEAMRAGALHFIEKPLDPAVLLEAINEALNHQNELVEQFARRQEAKIRLQRLTPREREVLALLVEGHLNKVIAGRLGISLRTAEHHRANIMAKLKARSLSQVVRMSLGDPDSSPRA